MGGKESATVEHIGGFIWSKTQHAPLDFPRAVRYRFFS
jgi:hypothetical protein